MRLNYKPLTHSRPLKPFQYPKTISQVATAHHHRRKAMAQNLPKLADWEQISTNVIRVMGGNPSKVRICLWCL